jgi:hypothetical protein
MIRIFLCVLAILFVFFLPAYAVPEPDKPFVQAVSVKYPLQKSLEGSVLKKIVTDYNDIVYVLSDRGVYRVCGDEVVKDVRYTPLENKIPVDITIQEKTGHLFYLYADHFLTNGYAGKPFADLPANKFTLFAVNADGDVLLAGRNNVSVYMNGTLEDIEGEPKNIIAVHCYKKNFFILSSTGVYEILNKQMRLIHASDRIKTITLRDNEIYAGTEKGYYSVDLKTGDTVTSLQTKVPVESIQALLNVNGKIWAASRNGGFMESEKGKYRYYASKRWLDDNNVTGIASDSKNDVYFLTNGCVNKVRFLTQTLAGKALHFQQIIRDRHIRYGFISNVTFSKPGDITTAKLTDTDNDGLWSSFYLGSQAFRYAVTKNVTAKRYAWEAFEAFERIISINPLKGFPARTFERKGFKNSDPERWHDSQEKGWEWKGTTSSDEFVGYIWVAAIMHQFASDNATEKKRVADFIDKILTHIIDNNYYFVDIDGKPTLWGRWNPEYINSFPETVGDRRLGSTTIIAGLQLGYALTGKTKYKTEALKLMNDFGYLKNIQLPYQNIQSTPGIVHQGVNLGEGGWNHSDDEMAFLTYWVLYRYAMTEDLKKRYAAAIIDHWTIEKPERNALWNLITFGTVGTFDRESVFWHLREFPMDLVRWDIKNSHRKDIELLPPNFRNQYTKTLLPPAEKPVHRHNTNAFVLDGGDHGMTELAGDEYLLPYWMARYLRVVQ